MIQMQPIVGENEQNDTIRHCVGCKMVHGEKNNAK